MLFFSLLVSGLVLEIKGEFHQRSNPSGKQLLFWMEAPVHPGAKSPMVLRTRGGDKDGSLDVFQKNINPRSSVKAAEGDSQCRNRPWDFSKNWVLPSELHPPFGMKHESSGQQWPGWPWGRCPSSHAWPHVWTHSQLLTWLLWHSWDHVGLWSKILLTGKNNQMGLHERSNMQRTDLA